MRAVLILLAALFAIGACEAFGHEAAPEPTPVNSQPAQVQPAPQYVTIYGAPRPIYATPVRTAIWHVAKPRAYYVPQQQVRVAVPCPHCRRPQ